MIGKAIGASWDTVRALLLLKGEAAPSIRHDLEHCAASFGRLQPETARKALRFYRLREQTVKAQLADGTASAVVPPVMTERPASGP